MAGDRQKAWNTALLSIYCYGRQGAQALAQQVAAKRLVSLDDAVNTLIVPPDKAALGQVRLALADLCRTSVETSDASLAVYVSKLAVAFAQLTGAVANDVSQAFAKLIQPTPAEEPTLTAAAATAVKAKVATPMLTPAEIAYQSAISIMVTLPPQPPERIHPPPQVDVLFYRVEPSK